MAQATKTTTRSSKSRNGSRATGSGKSAASKRTSSKSSSKRSSTNGSRANGSRAKSTSKQPQSRPTARSRNGAGSIKDTAIDQTKAAGLAVADAASKAKTPLIAGGTALVGAAVGVVVKDRLVAKRSNNPLKRLRGVSMPKPATKLDLSKLDLDTVKSAAERVSAYGQQASDIATAVEKTRKKNK
jgi:hypothetical protein